MPAFETSEHHFQLPTSQPSCVEAESTGPVLGFITPKLALAEILGVVDLPACRPREVSPF